MNDITESKDFYVYIYLDPRKPGKWNYKNLDFEYQPFYVGKGKNDRMEKHLKSYSLSRDDIKSKIILKILNNSLQPIRYKIFENIHCQEALDIEIDMIKHFGRIDLRTGILANMTDGGDGVINAVIKEDTRKKISIKSSRIAGPEWNSYYVYQKSMNGELIRKWNYLAQIKHELGYNLGTIKRNFGLKRGAYGFLWDRGEPSYQEPPLKMRKFKEKKIYQYSLDGNFIRSFDSIKEASIFIGIKNFNIHRCRKGRNRQCAGYQWLYKYAGEKINPIRESRAHIGHNKRPILSFDLEGNFIKEYESINAAMKDGLGNAYSKVSPLATGKLYKGKYWKFKN